jgi:hypothetical protein
MNGNGARHAGPVPDFRTPKAGRPGNGSEPIVRTSEPVETPRASAPSVSKGFLMMSPEAATESWNTWFTEGFDAHLRAAAGDINSPLVDLIRHVGAELLDATNREAGELIGALRMRVSELEKRWRR